VLAESCAAVDDDVTPDGRSVSITYYGYVTLSLGRWDGRTDSHSVHGHRSSPVS